MKPFSMRHILKDTCNNYSFPRKRKQSLCKMKKAPTKPVLKPFREEQQSTVELLQGAAAAPPDNADNQQSEDADYWSSDPL